VEGTSFQPVVSAGTVQYLAVNDIVGCGIAVIKFWTPRGCWDTSCSRPALRLPICVSRRWNCKIFYATFTWTN